LGIPDIEFVRGEIERMRRMFSASAGRSRSPNQPGTSAEALLDRMLNKIDNLCAERDRLKKEQPHKALRGRHW